MRELGKKIGLVMILGAIVGGGVMLAYWTATLHIRKNYGAAQRHLETGDLAQATKLFEGIYRKRPHSQEGFGSLQALCQILFAQGDHEKGLAYAEDYANLAKGPEDEARARYYIAFALFSQGKIVEADERLTGLIAQHPTTQIADDAYLLLAKVKRQRDRLGDAKELLRTIIERYPDSNTLDEVYEQYGQVNVGLLLSPASSPGSAEHTVQKGETLGGIARRYKTTVDLLRESNRLHRDMIRVGQTLKVDKTDYTVVVNKSRNTLTLLADGELFKSYSVGTGSSGSTPVGDFEVVNKLVDPVWYRPGGGIVPFGEEENVLGTRWMGISHPGYGIHGTWEPESIGQQSSAGCIRLLNREVEELFKIVQVGTPVKIVE